MRLGVGDGDPAGESTTATAATLAPKIARRRTSRCRPRLTTLASSAESGSGGAGSSTTTGVHSSFMPLPLHPSVARRGAPQARATRASSPFRWNSREPSRPSLRSGPRCTGARPPRADDAATGRARVRGRSAPLPTRRAHGQPARARARRDLRQPSIARLPLTRTTHGVTSPLRQSFFQSVYARAQASCAQSAASSRTRQAERHPVRGPVQLRKLILERGGKRKRVRIHCVRLVPADNPSHTSLTPEHTKRLTARPQNLPATSQPADTASIAASARWRRVRLSRRRDATHSKGKPADRDQQLKTVSLPAS